MTILYVFILLNTFLFVSSSFRDPGYLVKDPDTKLIDLLKIT